MISEEGRDPIVDAVEQRKLMLERELLAVDDALDAIMNTPPTTRGGARAVIEHLVEWDKDSAMETGRYLATLLRSPVLAG
jgi:hypothetical protein